jgi:hypothetical protein
MSCSQPTGGAEAVALDLPAPQRKILRSKLTDCLEGVSGDLRLSDRLPNRDGAQRDATAYERLLTAMDAGKIALPDEAAREAVEAMAIAIEEDTDYRHLVAEHDALFGLLDLLGGVKAEAR